MQRKETSLETAQGEEQAGLLCSQCARQVLDTVPSVMRMLRAAIRNSDGILSVPQARVLSFLNRHPGSSVSDVGVHMDVTIASASALIDRLVKRNMVLRRDDPTERRRVKLTVTKEGMKHLEAARLTSQSQVTRLLEPLTADQLRLVSEGLSILAGTLADNERAAADNRRGCDTAADIQ